MPTVLRANHRREDHLSHPVLERLGLGFVGTHDEFVEARLVDELHGFAGPAGDWVGVNRVYSLLRSIELLAGHRGVHLGTSPVLADVEVQYLAHVLRHEPRFTVNGDHADGGAPTDHHCGGAGGAGGRVEGEGREGVGG